MAEIKELLKTKLIFPLREKVFNLNNKMGRYKNVLWLIGDGRSGTTWIASVINADRKARELFEPYHPLVLENSDLPPYLYSSTDTNNNAVLNAYNDIFSGHLAHRRIDFDNRKLFYKGLIVKDIFINLSASILYKNFPFVKPVLLIRNPFAVVYSKLQKKHWFWPSDLDVYLKNSSLLNRLNVDIISLIEHAKQRNNFVEIQFIHWALGNCILLEDFSANNLHLIFYENIKKSPDKELAKLRAYLGNSFDFVAKSTNKAVYNKASRVVGKNKDRTDHKNTYDYWEQLYSNEEFELGVNVLKVFGWFEAYLPNGEPDPNFFKSLGFNIKNAL
ncbi:sulfotransferase domain-containing protein [Alteromonas macleodii]|uniref:sulfotransferase domain-containing protein n=1 Tax=Alteromonas macleodii TaxID=28108 RepID=UPI0022B021E1|nr:sulfotransferase domain-containing protein [Alteromonas macleodii]MCZ4239494.1 sulfotransferase domain-containing protein [Alteromonas macleodii]